MKLFVVAALVAVAAAGRLESLERSYLPPDNSIGVARSTFGSNGGVGSHGSFGGGSGSHGAFGGNSGSHGSFGGNSGSHGSFGGNSGSHGSFGGNSGAFGAAGAGLARNAGGFAGATSNQYLPPNHGLSGSNGGSQFGGLGGQQNFRSQQYSGHQAAPAQQYGSPSSQFGSQGGSSFGARSYQRPGQQSAAASRQYLAPHAGSYQQAPQQAFDEQTGYQY